MAAPAAHNLGATRQRDLGGAVGRGIVGDHDLGIGKRRTQRAQSGTDPVGLRDRLMEIPAHITGTVWKIEVAVGDEVDEGDTVVILESMKMEMPVEAEDPGTVKEIRCSEGQSVQEGDVLVVLE